MSDDETRKLILARRAKFVAAAIASVGIACGKTGADPQPCLSPPPMEQDATTPQPCLSVMIPVEPVDAAPPIQTDSDAGAQPQPCLSPMPNPPQDAGKPVPQPCLKVKPPTPQPCLSVAPKPTK